MSTEESLKETGRCAYAAIVEMVAALECDCDRLEELRESREDAEQRIQEDALSVQVRGDWYSPGDETSSPTEFELLLATGGPAVRIRGELDEHCEPARAWLEVQDWGTPWTRYFDASQDTLLAYVRCFYFGEG